MPFLKAKKIREEKEKEKNIQTAEPLEIPESEPIPELEHDQTVTDCVDENPGEKIDETLKHVSTSTNENVEISNEENKTDGGPEQEEEITKQIIVTQTDNSQEDESQTEDSQEDGDKLPEETPEIPEDSTPEENENPDGQDTSGDNHDTVGTDTTDKDGTLQDSETGNDESRNTEKTSGGVEIEKKYDFDSNERYVDKVSTKTEFDKVLDSLAAISKDLLSHEVERFAKKYADKYQGDFTKAEADAKKYEAFLGGYITNAAMTLYENNYMDAAIRQLDQAKNVLIATQKLKTETSAINERVVEEGAAVDLSDILGMFGDG